MSPSAEFRYDASTAIILGKRELQEDAIVADFPSGAGVGFAVLADGMGGHAAGDVASKIVVTEVFSELKLHSGDPEKMERDIPGILRQAAVAANDCVRIHSDTTPGTRGMGATLVSPVLVEDRLYWISIGDSPLFLFREGKLVRLNEDHSLVPQIDYLVSKGLMGIDEGLSHPDRHCLTSVLVGQHIPQVDCPLRPVRLMDGDIVIVASDGLQFLDEEYMTGLLRAKAHLSSADISAALIREIEALEDKDQDNVSMCVIKVRDQAAKSQSTDQVVHLPQKVALPPRRFRRKTLTAVFNSPAARGLMVLRSSSENTA